MHLAFHWFYLKSRSLLLVSVGAISDSYTDYYFFILFRCLAKTTTELATMCKHKPKTMLSGFAGVCWFLRAFWGFLRDVCGAVWSRFFAFCRFCAKVLLNRKSRRACRVRPAYPTPMHYSGSLKNCYLHARDTGGKSDETFKIIQAPLFFGISVFNDYPKKLGGFDHNW